MGHRANYITIKNNIYKVHYSHWGAQKVTTYLILGPEKIFHLIETQMTEHTELLDYVWAEGGLILDYDNKIGLFWQQTDIYSRFMDYLKSSKQWEGWNFKFAHYGQIDLANYLNVSPEKIFHDYPNLLNEANKEIHYYDPLLEHILKMDKEYEEDILTFIGTKKNNKIKAFNTPVDIGSLILRGYEFFNNFIENCQRKDLPENMIEACNFIFVDYDSKKLYVSWMYNDYKFIFLEKFWTDWEIIIKPFDQRWFMNMVYPDKELSIKDKKDIIEMLKYLLETLKEDNTHNIFGIITNIIQYENKNMSLKDKIKQKITKIWGGKSEFPKIGVNINVLQKEDTNEKIEMIQGYSEFKNWINNLENEFNIKK